ncbi:MFS transporter [Solicola gregarius]|uniref:MFS transporter n=1 Tax=Solicola gregarius TaxID=2908642 RepID=A0AA46TJT0_9ACTN|nr:MFS transporter [Solicola gregarius]UYM06423.1 MFS transporter [Solicola gregarius]
MAAVATPVRMATPTGRWLLVATILGSSIAMLDATVVNVALPRLGADLDAGVGGLQWTLNGYTLALASLILLGGALGDRWGRRRIFVVGVVWFAVASALCGLAPNVELLVAARVLQGVGGALLTPGSLALISASIDERDRGSAIGAWAGIGGVATAIGPIFGGWLVDAVSWRAVFLINVPVAVAIVWIALRHVPESRDESAARSIDVPGVVLGAAGLAALTYGLIASTLPVTVLGLVLLVLFGWQQRRAADPLMPLSMFADRVFAAANLVTLVVYAAIGGTFFLFVLFLQVVVGYTPLQAGAASLPITLLMLLLSSYAGALGERIGPRIPMTVGPLVGACGLLLMLRIDADSTYVADVLPAVVVFGLGLSTMVAPLTTAVLSAAPSSQAGLASGINNAIARTGQLLAVAALPSLVGIVGDGYADPQVVDDGFTQAMLICAGLLVGGAVTAALLVRRGPSVHEIPVERQARCGVDCPASYPE